MKSILNRFHTVFFTFLLTFYSLSSWGQIEGEVLKPQAGKFLLTHATIHTVTQGILENTAILIENGKIAQLGTSIAATDAEEIDCTGLVIYPGMIDSGTRLGLVEIGSVEETNDYQEIGKFTPNMQALTAVNPNSEAIPVTRVSGVTTVLTVPQGGLFPGTAALINLVGYTPDQMDAGFRGVVLNFPSSIKRGRWDRRSDEEVKKDAEKSLKELNDIWENAVRYHSLKQNGASLEYYPEMDHMDKVLSGKSTLLIEVNAATDILNAIKWVEEKEIKVIFTGVKEGWRVADKLAESGIPVITGPVQDLPARESDRYDAAYTNAGKMMKAGVHVSLRTNDTENVRNLPFHAAFAAAYGMGKEEAWKAVTINPAKLFGLDDQLGSIEVGKTANLIVATGDPFETKSQIKQVFINGYKIPMTNRHIRLYQEFLERSPGLNK